MGAELRGLLHSSGEGTVDEIENRSDSINRYKGGREMRLQSKKRDDDENEAEKIDEVWNED